MKCRVVCQYKWYDARCAAAFRSKEYARDIDDMFAGATVQRSPVATTSIVHAAVDDVPLYCLFYFRFSATDQALIPCCLCSCYKPHANCVVKRFPNSWLLHAVYMITWYFHIISICYAQHNIPSISLFRPSACLLACLPAWLPACLHSCTLSSTMFAKHQSLYIFSMCACVCSIGLCAHLNRISLRIFDCIGIWFAIFVSAPLCSLMLIQCRRRRRRCSRVHQTDATPFWSLPKRTTYTLRHIVYFLTSQATCDGTYD